MKTVVWTRFDWGTEVTVDGKIVANVQRSTSTRASKDWVVTGGRRAYVASQAAGEAKVERRYGTPTEIKLGNDGPTTTSNTEDTPMTGDAAFAAASFVVEHGSILLFSVGEAKAVVEALRARNRSGRITPTAAGELGDLWAVTLTPLPEEGGS